MEFFTDGHDTAQPTGRGYWLSFADPALDACMFDKRKGCVDQGAIGSSSGAVARQMRDEGMAILICTRAKSWLRGSCPATPANSGDGANDLTLDLT